ncbi:TonB-dependent receptor [Ramlibacter sp.]|uniref:TonB-dependent receptor n=1 Tax=Ramlibacter sp. TaxID=1917967 RepID=UPI00260260D4|nr:TonB-dependent receptor [Ramlibacter sp.]MDB5956614.1 btuB [Ramlibacter sp.]
MNRIELSPRALSCLLAAAFLSTPCAFGQSVPTLAETRVTATRFSEDEASLPLGVSVIDADAIRASGATSVPDAIARILGVPARQDLLNGGDATLDLRGFGATADNNQVVILDGVRLSEADTSAARIAVIPVDSVERIEVLRGSGAVLYGEGATGGVIVITTKAGAGRQQPTGGTVYGAAGSHGLRDLRASGTASFASGLSLQADAQKRSTDGYRVNSASDTQAEALGAQWSNEWLRLGARLSHDELDAGLPGALTAAQFAADPRQSTHPQDHVNVRNDLASVFARADLAGWELAFDAGHREKRLRSVNVTASGSFPFDFDVDADTYALRARREAAIGDVRNIFVAGSDVNAWRRDVLGQFGGPAAMHSTGFYLKDDVVLPAGTRISLGGRTETIRKDNQVDPPAALADRVNAWELGLSQALGAGWTGYARAGRSFRLANVDEFNFTTPGVSLLPQTSRDFELGTRWHYAKGKLEARLYRSDLRNEIGFDPNAVGPSSLFGFNGANVNFDPTRRQGAELDWSHTLNAALLVRANLAYRQARFRSGPYAGNDVPLVPRRTAAVRADWTLQPGQRLSGGLNWVSSQHPDFENTCRMPAYFTADARYAWQFHPQAELALGVTNLFNRQYFTQAFACDGAQATSVFPEPGRQFTASVRLQF